MMHYDFIGFCETKCDDPPKVANFVCFTKMKTKKNKRSKFGAIHGLCVYVKSEHAERCKIVPHTESDAVLWLKYDHPDPSESFIIAMTYFPPDQSEHASQDIYNDIDSDIINLKAAHHLPIIWLGDDNARTSKLNDILVEDNYGNFEDVEQENKEPLAPRVNSDGANCNKNGFNLVNMCRAFDLVIVNGRFGKDAGIGKKTCITTRGSSTVDYAIVSRSITDKILDFEVLDFDPFLSDIHCPVLLRMKKASDATASEPEPEPDHQIGRAKCSVKWIPELAPEYRARVDRNSLAHIENRLDQLASEGNVNSDVMNSLYEDINQALLEPAKELGIAKEPKPRPAPNRRNKRTQDKTRPWFDRDCRASQVEYFRHKNRCKRQPSQEQAATLKNLAKKHKRLLRTKMKAHRKDFEHRLRELKSSNPRDYYKLLQDNSSFNQSQQPDLETLLQHFKKISDAEPLKQNENEPNQETTGNTTDYDTSKMNEHFTEEELRKIAKKLKNNKACGMDSIVNEFIKNSPDEFFRVSTKLFNLILDTGFIPSSWCVGLIKPLYKNKGSRMNPDNYRGITLLSCFGKWFTAVLNDRIHRFLDENSILGKEQAGFRENYSTLDHIFALHIIVDFYLHKKKKLYACFIDFRKAFDYVDRSALWCKIMNAGISGKILTVIQNLYSGAKSAVVSHSGSISEKFPCNLGLRQGENLSPVLFACFLNDFSDFLSKYTKGLSRLGSELSNDDEFRAEMDLFRKLYLLLYADDTIALSETEKDLKKMMKGIEEYCKKFRLEVNIEKTKIVVFSRGKVQNLPNVYFNDNKLEVVSDYLYLGVLYNYNGRFKKAIEDRVTKAKKAVYSLKTKARNLGLPLDILIDLFQKSVLPVVTYSCEIWGFDKNVEQVEKFERNFLRSLLKLSSDTSCAIVYGEFGVTPVIDIIKSRMLNFWYKTVTGAKDKISSLLYTFMKFSYSKKDGFQSKWLGFIHKTLNEIGLNELWRNQSLSLMQFKNVVKSRLREHRTDWYYNELGTNIKCSFYHLVKQDRNCEKYFSVLDDYKLVIALARFRCRCGNLPIVGAVREAKKNGTLILPECKLCNEGIADEFHYLFMCPHFHNLRQKLLPNFVLTEPSVMSCKTVFNARQTRIIKNLARLVFEISKYFDE